MKRDPVRSLVPFCLFAAAPGCDASMPGMAPAMVAGGGTPNAGAAGTSTAGMPVGGMAPLAMAGSNSAGRVSMGGTAGMPPGAAGMAAGGMSGAGTSAGGVANAGAPMGGSSMGGTSIGGTSMGGGDVGGSGGEGGTGGGAVGAEFALTAPWDSDEACSAENQSACSDIPAQYRMNGIGGDNEMPAFSWTAGPDGTQSYVLVYQDLSFEMQGRPFVHWALWNIPAATTSVDGSSIPTEADQASFQGGSWAGSGACGNVYELVLYALSVDSYMPGGDPADVRDGLDGDDLDLVLDRDTVRGSTLDPCN